ncbi:hypothetical protein F4775DRAFT_547295 [Biscogniauxia sp. FL1348]|nr:hypothetical protein F4775DRAFT_547295 [Biscogniauxia sp. FL1348]
MGPIFPLSRPCNFFLPFFKTLLTIDFYFSSAFSLSVSVKVFLFILFFFSVMLLFPPPSYSVLRVPAFHPFYIVCFL